jgi:hypothetical protein
VCVCACVCVRACKFSTPTPTLALLPSAPSTLLLYGLSHFLPNLMNMAGREAVTWDHMGWGHEALAMHGNGQGPARTQPGR